MSKAYKFNKMDEFYTPREWVEYIVDFLEKEQKINKDMKIWCPFDLEQSNFVKVLKDKGYKVIYSHLNSGQDFYDYEPKEWDIIISNPPFSNKTKTLQRLKTFDENKKWVLIFGNQFFQTGSFMRELNTLEDLTIVSFEKRMWFVKDYDNSTKPKTRSAFASVLLCNNLKFKKGFNHQRYLKSTNKVLLFFFI